MHQTYTILLFFICLFSGVAYGQVCTPDPQYADEPAGVYPRPDTMNGTDPTIGIHVKACIGEPYEFVFTAIVPNEIEEDILGTGVPLVAQLNYVKLLEEDPILIDNGSGDISTFESITTLGINYECDPPDCIFNANTSGCMRLYSESVTADIGEYVLVIRTKASLNLFNVPIELQVNFPSQPGDALTVSQGEYRLTIGEGADCLTSVENPLSKGHQFKLFPNPSNGAFKIAFDKPVSENTNLGIFNILGQRIYTEVVPQGSMQYEFVSGILPDGIYLLELTSGEIRTSEKIQIIR